MINISNDKLSVKIAEKGAELQSLQYDGIEYIWQAAPEYWGKHSPVLFPIVGELKKGRYLFEDREYTLPRHGFARDRVFEGRRISADVAEFTLKSDEKSLVLYPFSFIFRLVYRLQETRLSCTYSVENTGTRSMYFSVGGHPAFNVPLQPSLNYTDYSLRFNNDPVLKKHLLHNGLTGDDTEDIMLVNNELPMQSSLFYEDAIVLKHIVSSQVELVTPKDTHGLKFMFENFPYFGIWAAKDAPFVCLEPWCGIADSIHHDHELVHKEGINQVGPRQSWQRTWSVEVY